MFSKLFNPNSFRSLNTSLLRYSNRFNLIQPKQTQIKQIKLKADLRNVNAIFTELSPTARRSIGIWLLTCSGLTFTTVVIGGITRITKSGLSMVDWHLFKEFPPMSKDAWAAEFEKYKQYPEFKKTNFEMSIEEFKRIWYMEYIHRMLGRTIGAAFVLPAAFFWYKKWFAKPMKIRTVLLSGLLLTQGFLGWYMVKSGLDETITDNYAEPRVSHYRLAAHLGTAFVFYSLLLWNGLAHLYPPNPIPITQGLLRFRKLVHTSRAFIFITALSGALVAGTDAGLVYNTWPKMADRWIPDDLLARNPKWKNFLENPTTLQFDHRHLGEFVFCLVTGSWLYSRRLPLNSRMRLAVNFMQIAATTQVILGISTLLLHCRKELASAHQAGALVLLSTAIWLTHELKIVKFMPK